MKKYLIYLYFFLFISMGKMLAQMPHDAIYMNKRLACGAIIYGNNSWTNYWENGLKRDNPNIGRLTTQSMTAMIAYGLHKQVNVIAVVPYIKTDANQGNLHGKIIGDFAVKKAKSDGAN